MYKSIQDNGIINTGLQAALDVGANERYFINVPKCAVIAPVLRGVTDIDLVTNLTSGKRLKEVIPIIVDGNSYSYKTVGIEYLEAGVSSAKAFASLIVVNYHSSLEAGHVRIALNYIIATHEMAFTLGAVHHALEYNLSPQVHAHAPL